MRRMALHRMFAEGEGGFVGSCLLDMYIRGCLQLLKMEKRRIERDRNATDPNI